jgi:hypothetical protein
MFMGFKKIKFRLKFQRCYHLVLTKMPVCGKN